MGLIFAPYFGFVAKGALSITNTQGRCLNCPSRQRWHWLDWGNWDAKFIPKKLHVIWESYLYAQDGKFRILARFPAILIEGFVVISPHFSVSSEKCGHSTFK